MTLNEIYKELYEFMKIENNQDIAISMLSDLNESKRLLVENKVFNIIETQEIRQKYIENIDRLIIEKKELIDINLTNKLFDLLTNLFEDYIKAVKKENEGDFIKHDVIIEMNVKKGSESHLENMLNYISEKLPINIARIEKNENGISKALVTMTSFDLLSLNNFLVKMSRGLVEFEARTIMPDMVQRTITEHNDLLNQDNKLDLTNGRYVGYFMKNYRIPIGSQLAIEAIRENFFDIYRTSKFIHNKNNVALQGSEITYQYVCNQDIYGRIYNPFTEFEYKEKQSQENNFANKNKRPKM